MKRRKFHRSPSSPPESRLRQSPNPGAVQRSNKRCVTIGEGENKNPTLPAKPEYRQKGANAGRAWPWTSVPTLCGVLSLIALRTSDALSASRSVVLKRVNHSRTSNYDISNSQSAIWKAPVRPLPSHVTDDRESVPQGVGGIDIV